MRCWIVLAALVTAAPARAEDATADLGGIVVDAATGGGIAGALITSDDATAEAGLDGRFALTGVRARRVAVFVFADGYAPAEAELTARVPGRIELHRDVAGVEIIEVSGKAPDAASPTAYTFNREQIRALPGSGNDVLRALQSMPGVSRTPYGIGGLILRGASPHESTIFLDGIEVPLAYHFAGLTSFYPSTLLDEVTVSPGGADVAFGRGIGGVVELRGRRARGDRYRVGAEVGVFDASLFGEAPLGGGDVALGLRRSYADAFLAALLPDDRPVFPRYYDGQVRWDRAAGGGTLTLLGFFSDDRIVGWGGTDYRQGFARVAARWQRTLGRTSVSVMPWAGVGRTEVVYVLDENDDRPDLEQVMRLDRHPVGLRADLRRDTGWGHVAGGLDLQGARVGFTQSADLLSGSEELAVDTGAYLDAGLWLETRWRIDDGKLTIKPGVRLDYLGVADSFVVEPRLATTHELAPWLTLRETIGYHHQPPGPITAAHDPDTRGTIQLGDPHGMTVQGLHTSVGARLALPAAVVASVTAYHVLRRGPVDPGRTEDGEPTDDLRLPFESGLGLMFDNLIGEEFSGITHERRRGAGVELSVQRRTDRLLLWLSYTYARSQGRPAGPTRQAWAPEPFEQPHNLNVVGSVRLGAWQLGARFRYTTGLPYTGRTSATYDMMTESWRYERGPTNGERLPAYVSLDVRIDRTWRRRWGALAVFLDLSNVTNNHNPEGVSYDEGATTPSYDGGLPVLPLFGLSYQPPD